MEDDIFNLLKEKLFPFASVVDLRGWGESTILKNFYQRVAETAETGVKIRLVTNALSIKTDLWKLLMNNDTTVVLSVDASTPETMKKLGRGSFGKLIKSLETGVNEKEQSNFPGDIFFNTVVSNYNLEEIEDIVRLAAKYRIKRVTLTPVLTISKSPLYLGHREAEILKYILPAQKVAVENGVELRLAAGLGDSQIIQANLLNRCSHPWSHCCIDYAGNVGYCDHLVGGNLMLGNLRSNSFSEIWNGESIQKIRAFHVKYQCEKDILPNYKCHWCYKRRYVDFEDDINKKFQSKIVSTAFCHSIFPEE
jgi:radical SAM protein with 4Fe4S-binding SPASM domain